MKHYNIKEIVKKAVNNTEITVNTTQMIRTFYKAHAKEKTMNALTFSDLFGGIMLLIFGLIILLQNPSSFTNLPVFGQLGLALFCATFIYHHYLSFRIRRKTVPLNPNLKDLLRFQLTILKQRKKLLESYKFMLIVGLAGLYLLFLSLSFTFVNALFSFLILMVFGIIIYFLSRRQLHTIYLPLEQELTTNLESLA